MFGGKVGREYLGMIMHPAMSSHTETLKQLDVTHGQFSKQQLTIRSSVCGPSDLREHATCTLHRLNGLIVDCGEDEANNGDGLTCSFA